MAEKKRGRPAADKEKVHVHIYMDKDLHHFTAGKNRSNMVNRLLRMVKNKKIYYENNM
jgi:hypothetical protein